MTAVCILAAGQGTRVSAFRSRLHKALLPLGPMAVLSHIIMQTPADARVVIAVGHLADQIKAYVGLAHPDHDVTFVDVQCVDGPGSGPGRSLWECRDLLDQPFLLTAADTIVDGIPHCGEESWMGVASVADPTKWCTVVVDEDGHITGLRYRDPDGGHLGYTGIAWVAEPGLFFRGLQAEVGITGELQVNAGFEAMIGAGRSPRAVPVEWTDTGTDENYATARQRWSGSLDWGGKETDATYVVGNRVVKWFADSGAASRRVDRHLTGLLPLPRFVGSAPSWLAYDYVRGPTLADDVGEEATTRALDWAEREVWSALPHDAAFVEDCAGFYFKKTADRIGQAMTGLEWSTESEEVRINGIMTRPVLENLNRAMEGILSSAIPSTFHGDFHDGNVIDGPDGLVAIDWRDSFGTSLVRGDRIYDLAKFIHTLELSHEVMSAGFFTISRSDDDVTISHRDSPRLSEGRSSFWAWVDRHGYSSSSIGIVDALVFCNMAPLYRQPLSEYLYLLGRLLLHSRLLGGDAIESVLEGSDSDRSDEGGA